MRNSLALESSGLPDGTETDLIHLKWLASLQILIFLPFELSVVPRLSPVALTIPRPSAPSIRLLNHVQVPQT